ncbi:hypothetical protein G6F26_004969 [Rhizopus arrhizus]|nr:hypothetical protein G6F30_004793 [Rhizopus arrhizus]KAG1009786.1 hypothetical protein G6F27_005266 [Rhizopus arrhizus]KAG1025614.1 hypothetical protein G6F26_004969 [Rhizopus arrhizus]KAG1040454.1 hypothetical protein G6F25_004768 [Rhizopus arrhizus]KAG1071127.1 hypothetical protein G6F41_004602 [Rhizopus arrhizus]
MEGFKAINKPNGNPLKIKQSSSASPNEYSPSPSSHASSSTDIVVKSDEEATTDQENTNSKATLSKAPLSKVYKTVVIQQKMTFGNAPCNPLLWNNEDVEKNAPWMAVEESINSFKSAWFEGENDDIEDEEEKPTKKTAKRGRPPSNSKQQLIEVDQQQPLIPKRKNSGSSSKKSNMLDSKLYCVCRQPYDATRFMIACDRCDDWFHGECISIKEVESEFVDLYFCSNCSKVTGKKTSWKPKCSNPACNKAARISSHLGYISKYCSNVCGMQVARARLELLEIKRRNATNANSLTPISELAIAKQKQSTVNSLADKQDRERLVQIRQEKKNIKFTVDILKRKSKFIDLLVKQKPFTEEDGGIPCGFDSRLIWKNHIWSKIIQNSNVDVQMQITIDSISEPFNVCQRLKCIKHRQWQKLALIEMKQEKKEQFNRLLSLEKERSQIKSHFAWCTMYKRDYKSRNYYTLRTSDPNDINFVHHIISHLDARYEGKVGELSNYYWISVLKEHDNGKLRYEFETLLKKRGIQTNSDIRHQVPTTNRIMKRSEPPFNLQQELFLFQKDIKKTLAIDDPGFDRQWHLVKYVNINTQEYGHDLNISGVWKQGITGKGTIVAILDDGLDFEHMDLRDNYFPEGSYDFNDHVPDPKPRLIDDVHGTRCAGEIAAVKNDACGIGVAYDAKISGIRILSGEITEADEAAALNYKYQENQIYSCSWGPPDLGEVAEGPQGIILDAIRNGIENGRQGKGSIFVFASGNGGHNDDNCNFDGYTNSIYTITVGAIDRLGNYPSYAEKCAAQFFVTYSSGSGNHIYTTDVHSNQCSEHHGGTSAAAPLAAGVFALVLSVRPDLSWRDLQHLCVQSAIPISLHDDDWTNLPSGRMFNHKYGFGVLDAYRIVELANKFRSVGPQTHLEVSLGNIEPFEIPDITFNNKDRHHALKSAIQVTEEMVLSASLSLLEHVTVTVHIEHQRRGDLEILLVSPNNVTSQLGTPRKNDNSKEGLVNWTFMSVKHWEEQPVGNWTLWIIDERNPEFKGKLIHWKITLWGENKNGVAAVLANSYEASIQSFLLKSSSSKQKSLLTYVLISVYVNNEYEQE